MQKIKEIKDIAFSKSEPIVNGEDLFPCGQLRRAQCLGNNSFHSNCDSIFPPSVLGKEKPEKASEGREWMVFHGHGLIRITISSSHTPQDNQLIVLRGYSETNNRWMMMHRSFADQFPSTRPAPPIAPNVIHYPFKYYYCILYYATYNYKMQVKCCLNSGWH